MREVYSKNPTLAYLSINFLRNKIVSLRDVVAKVFIDMLWIDETKLNDSFPASQFLIENYQFYLLVGTDTQKVVAKLVMLDKS